ncbi:MAG: carbohydrate kinase family protein [Gemmatimonadetes bacterium]|nr:carbohydrate kinase family protein [Gemmatimonadota bacterium]
MVRDLDALYVNFISGWELTLETARHLRHGFAGPIYADLHSLFLGVARGGVRVPQALDDPTGWFSCFDVVQMNQDEMDRMGPDPMAIAAGALGAGVHLLVVTLGPRGAVYFTCSRSPLPASGSPAATGPIQTARVPSPEVVAEAEADPTGCGDVFGATLFARLLAGAGIEPALRDANSWAARNATCRGATGLLHQVRGGIAVP